MKLQLSLSKLMFGLLVLSAISCQKEALITIDDQQPHSRSEQLFFNPIVVTPCGDMMTTTLYAGQNNDIGTVSVYNDGTNLAISFSTSNGWQLDATHIYIGDLGGMPVNGAGNPKLGHFPYGQSYAQGSTSDTYVISLSSLPSCFIVAFHAEASSGNGNNGQDETAWAFGTDIPNSTRWGWYIDYCVQSCSNEDLGNEHNGKWQH